MSIISKIFYLLFFIILVVAFIKITLGLLVVLVLLAFLRTWQMTKEPNQQDFLAGRLPDPKLDGFYQGSTGFKTSWVGKKFDAGQSQGINVFENDKKVRTERYTFATSFGKGLFDKDMLVMKIDYNVKGNPLWIRWILDEVVQIAPGQYLGKMNIRIIPGLPFSVLFFELRK